ncbi:MAG: hypothetical protein K8I82_19245 [Anaerolineae bacterium]|nr:hypothetical protein [Anaerolineae bacterium]
MGKTAIAATLAAQTLQKGQTVLWLHTNTLEKMLRQTLWLYEIRAEQDITSQVASLLKKYQPLVIISGSQQHDAAAQFVWACTHHQVAALLIHETAADGPWEPVLVRRLGYGDSQQLFTSIAGIEPPELSQFLNYCDGHPLSVELAARQIASRAVDLATIVAKLPASSTTLRQRVLAVIDAAFHSLDTGNQGLLLALCANFSHGISADVIRVVINSSLGITQQLCQQVAKRGFITARTTDGHTYYLTHSLIQEFATMELHTNNRYMQAKNRLLESIVKFAKSNTLSRELLVLEMDNFIGAAAYAVETEKLDVLRVLLMMLNQHSGLTERRGYAEDIRRLAGHLGAAAAAIPDEVIDGEFIEEKPSPPPSSIPLVDSTLKTTDIRPPESLEATLPQELNSTALIPADSPLISCQALEIALQAATNRRDKPEMARLSVEVGRCYAEQQQPDRAMLFYQQAIDINQEIGDLANVLIALEYLTLISQVMEGPEQSLTHTRRGFNIARQLGDQATMARFLSLSGDAYAKLGDTNNAINVFKQAIKIERGMNRPEETGITLGKLAAIYMDCNRYREAAAALSQAVSLFTEIGRKDLHGRALGNLGTALGHLGHWREAGQRHAAALHIARETGDVDEEYFQLRNLAYVAEMEGLLKWAVNYNRQALYLALLARDGTAISELTFELGRLLAVEEETIPQAAILLQHSIGLNARLEALRLLETVRSRMKKQDKKYPAEPDIYTYAAGSYPNADLRRK